MTFFHLRHARILALAILTPLTTTGCSGPPPTLECLVGDYVVNKNHAVKLSLDGRNFLLTVHGEQVSGVYGYDASERPGRLPGSASIGFLPHSGAISSTIKELVYDETGTQATRYNKRDILDFLNRMEVGSEVTLPAQQYGAAGAVSIVLDGDFDTPSMEFTKAGCG